MAKIKVTLEFEYDTEENITDWILDDCDIVQVDGLDTAIAVARAELRTHSSYDFIFKAYFEDSPDTAIMG